MSDLEDAIAGNVIEAPVTGGGDPRLAGGKIVTLLFIHATNSEFRSRDQGAEYDRPADALDAGVRGAVAMLADEIERGMRNAAIEISVNREDGTPVLRSVVSVSVSSLLVALPDDGETARIIPAV